MVKKVITSTKTFGRVRNFKATINYIRDTVTSIDAKLTPTTDDRLGKLREAYHKVDPYQPLYGISGFGDPQRSSGDRCEAIFAYFNNNVSGVRFLDIGCYFGYVSFYLADRGAKATGWDYWTNNIEVCNRAKDINGVPAEFKYEKFGIESVEKIQKNQFDVAIILSVLHWTLHEEGLEYVQECMRRLFDKVPVLVVELAQRGEDSKLYWDKSVPENDLAIFDKVQDIEIEKIGHFPTHLSSVKRPLYVISKKHLTVNKTKYLIDEKKTQAYKGAPAWRDVSSKYYVSGDVFIKEHSFGVSDDISSARALNEISFLLYAKHEQRLKKERAIPQIVDFETSPSLVKIVLKRIEGGVLSDIKSADAGVELAERVVTGLLPVLCSLGEVGLHHNDVRSWNVVLSKTTKAVSLIDYELVSAVQDENEAIALLWVINTALTGHRETTDRQKLELPPRGNFKGANKLTKVYDYVQRGGRSFEDMLKMVKVK